MKCFSYFFFFGYCMIKFFTVFKFCHFWEKKIKKTYWNWIVLLKVGMGISLASSSASEQKK